MVRVTCSPLNPANSEVPSGAIVVMEPEDEAQPANS